MNYFYIKPNFINSHEIAHATKDNLQLSLSTQEDENLATSNQISFDIKEDEKTLATAFQLSLDTQLINLHETNLKGALLFNNPEQTKKNLNVTKLQKAADWLAAINQLSLQHELPVLKLLSLVGEDIINYSTLASLPQQTIYGEKYYLTGNSSYEEAEIRCFAENHSLWAILDPVRWSFIKNASTNEDVAYIEGCYSGHKAYVTKTSELSELVLNSKNCLGWEPLENLQSDQNFLTYQHSLEELEAIKKSLPGISKSNILKFLTICKIMYEKTLHWNPPALDRLLDTLNELDYGKQLLLKEKLYHETEIALSEAILINKNYIDKIIKETFEIRQKSLFKACDSQDWKIKYVVAGMDHFPTPFNVNKPGLESTRKYFSTKKHCVLISEKILAYKKNKMEEGKQLLIEHLEKQDTYLNGAMKEAVQSQQIEAAINILHSEGSKYLSPESNNKLISELKFFSDLDHICNLNNADKQLRDIDLREAIISNFLFFNNLSDESLNSIQVIALAKSQEDRFTESIPLYSFLTILNPNSHNWYSLELEFFENGNIDLAYKAFDTALSLDPSHINARSSAAQCLIEQELYSEAIDELNMAMSIAKENNATQSEYNNILDVMRLLDSHANKYLASQAIT
ncbi:MAG: tetratricopeptide repeat protein [Candidatus Protochlamydia sp.]|nr:tetratricopeptide repeat protein [Candidatus Protochlamydia sp.]